MTFQIKSTLPHALSCMLALLCTPTLTWAMPRMFTPPPIELKAPLQITPVRFQRDQTSGVRHFTDEELENYIVTSENGLLHTREDDELLGQHLYFLSTTGVLYMIPVSATITTNGLEIFHSSFDRITEDRRGYCKMAGEMLIVKNSKFLHSKVFINNDSGHYKPRGGLLEIEPVKEHLESLGFQGTIELTLEQW